jgi:hypothetical protein
VPKQELDYFRVVKCDKNGKVLLNEFEKKMMKIIHDRRKLNNQIYEQKKLEEREAAQEAMPDKDKRKLSEEMVIPVIPAEAPNTISIDQ